MYSPNDFQFDGIGYRVSCADVQFFNSEKEIIEGVEFRLSKGEITDWGQACYEFETKEVLQQIWYTYDCATILNPNYFRIDEELRDNFMADRLFKHPIEYVENKFRALLVHEILRTFRARYGENMTDFGKRLGYSRTKISRIENYGFSDNYGYSFSEEEVNRIHEILKIN